jgi:predicted nucleic acid-binding protein
MSPGITLDAGALIAFERGDRRVVALLARGREVGAEVIVPATALAQVVRAPARQAKVMSLLRQPLTKTVALDRVDASFVGQLLAATGTADIADAHVAVCARRAGHAVVTSDGDDLRRLDPELTLIEV